MTRNRHGSARARWSGTPLVLRLDSAARYREGGGSFGAEFERAFGEGYAAAQAAE